MPKKKYVSVEERKKAKAELMRARYHAKAAQGICPRCGRHPLIPGKHVCVDCRPKENKRNHRSRRAVKGVCGNCGARPPREGALDCERCLTQKSVWAKRKNAEIKQTVLMHYGGVCVCCGEYNLAFLVLDHINNDGGKERKISKGSGFYTALIKKGFPDNLQVLCCNCNWGKHINGGVCPHERGVFAKTA